MRLRLLPLTIASALARHSVQVRKGDTVGQFLKAVVEQLMPQFREMR